MKASFDNFRLLSKTKQKKLVRNFVRSCDGFKAVAVETQRCVMRRLYGNGNRPSEWYCENVPAAHYMEQQVYKRYHKGL